VAVVKSNRSIRTKNKENFAMFGIRSFTTCAALAAAVLFATAAQAVAADDKSAAAEKERKLIEVLGSDAPAKDKAIPCKQLAIYGTKNAVPALAALLPDKELSSWARTALEAIPDPAADEALREALEKVQGRLLVGVINSIGVRRDAKAADVLAQRLKNAAADADVAAAAAVALGRIGGESAAASLKQSLPGAPAPVRSAIAQGCVLCAEKCLAEGKREEAARLYDLVRTADVSKPRIVEATRGAILARQSAGLPLLVEQLRSDDKDLFGIGLRTARELGGPAVAKALVAELDRIQPVQPQRQASPLLAVIKAQYGTGKQQADVTDRLAAAIQNNQLSLEATNDLAGDPAPGKVKELRVTYAIGGQEKTVVVREGQTLRLGEAVPEANPREVRLIEALGDVGQAAGLPAILKAAQGGSWGARLAAIRALRRFADDSCVPVLLAAATEANAELSQIAVDVLSDLPGKGADEQIATALLRATGKARPVLIQLAGQRRVEAAMPTLLQAAKDSDEQLRCAALVALGRTVGLRDLSVLIHEVVSPRTPESGRAAEGALRAASIRMPDREACAASLLAAMSPAPAPAKLRLLEILAAVGGAKALQTVGAAAQDPDPQMQDTATRLLGEWTTPDAAPALLELAGSGGKYQTRALRGYLRIARQMDVPTPERVAMCRAGWRLCRTDQERKLVLQGLRKAGCAEALALALPHLSNAALRAEAAAATVGIAEKLIQSDPAAVAAAMKQVLAAGASGKVADKAKTLLEQAARKLAEQK
jgi:HEAT repeat protein